MQATCEDAALFCNTNSRASLRARQFCPHTCGCDNPRSGQAVGLPIGGCPPSCSRAASYQQALNVDCTVFFELYHASRESFTCKKSGLSDRTNPLLLLHHHLLLHHRHHRLPLLNNLLYLILIYYLHKKHKKFHQL